MKMHWPLRAAIASVGVFCCGLPSLTQAQTFNPASLESGTFPATGSADFYMACAAYYDRVAARAKVVGNNEMYQSATIVYKQNIDLASALIPQFDLYKKYLPAYRSAIEKLTAEKQDDLGDYCGKKMP